MAAKEPALPAAPLHKVLPFDILKGYDVKYGDT
jgi:hypothetical protein